VRNEFGVITLSQKNKREKMKNLSPKNRTDLHSTRSIQIQSRKREMRKKLEEQAAIL
jgi:hypothetical protein